ncbi:hypothetical protein CPC197_1432 [Chlamydia psittaci C1/97]|nr:hypothetical protein CPC197_1432 [Chlamydia psittaci C1/97]
MELAKVIWKPIEGYGEKGNIFPENWKEDSEKLLCVLLIHLTELHFLRICSVFC